MGDGLDIHEKDQIIMITSGYQYHILYYNNYNQIIPSLREYEQAIFTQLNSLAENCFRTMAEVIKFLEQNYTNIHQIGKGGSSAGILSGCHRGNQEFHAIKVIDIQNISENEKICITREINLLYSTSHEHILKFIHSEEVAGYCLLYTKLCEKSLYEYMKEEARKEKYLRLLAETARGAAYLHSFKPHPIIHRDLKPGNIFLEWTVSNGYSAKIGDFGLAKQISMGGNTASTIVAGTLQYMPFEWIEPDNVTEDRNNPSGDIWALGVMIYEVLEGKSPFPHVQYRRQFIKAVKHMQYYPMSVENRGWEQLIKGIFRAKDKRLSAMEIAQNIELLLTHAIQLLYYDDNCNQYIHIYI